MSVSTEHRLRIRLAVAPVAPSIKRPTWILRKVRILRKTAQSKKRLAFLSFRTRYVHKTHCPAVIQAVATSARCFPCALKESFDEQSSMMRSSSS